MIATGGVLQAPVSILLTATTKTDVFAAPAGQVVTVNGFRIVNTDSSTCLVTLWWSNGTDYPIFRTTMAANSTFSDDELNIQLNGKATGRKIIAQAAAANVITVTLITTMSQQQT